MTHDFHTTTLRTGVQMDSRIAHYIRSMRSAMRMVESRCDTSTTALPRSARSLIDRESPTRYRRQDGSSARRTAPNRRREGTCGQSDALLLTLRKAATQLATCVSKPFGSASTSSSADAWRGLRAIRNRECRARDPNRRNQRNHHQHYCWNYYRNYCQNYCQNPKNRRHCRQ